MEKVANAPLEQKMLEAKVDDRLKVFIRSNVVVLCTGASGLEMNLPEFQPKTTIINLYVHVCFFALSPGLFHCGCC